MNCTILNLFLKLSMQNSPLLIGSSYSLQNKLSLEKIKISHSFSPFYRSNAINPLKFNAKMSSFSHFLDAAFRIDSQPVQYFGEKFVGQQNITSDLSFESCFLVNIKFFSDVEFLNFKFDSCYFLGAPSGYLILLRWNLVMNQCYLEDIAPTKSYNCIINDTALNIYKVDRILLHIYQSCKCTSSNFTNIDTIRAVTGMYLEWYNMYNVICTNNRMYNTFLNNRDSSSINCIFYNNTYTKSIFAPIDENGRIFTLTIENTLLFIDKPSQIITCFTQGYTTLNFYGCCFSQSEDDMRKACKEKLFFYNSTFNTNECKLYNLDDIELPPNRIKFDYKVIGDIEEEFEIENKKK